MQDSKPLDHPIWDLGSPQTKLPLDAFGFRIPNRWTTRSKIWVVPNQITPWRVWIQDSKPLDHLIWDLGSPQAKLNPDAFGFRISNRWTTQFEIWIVSKPQITLDMFGFKIPSCRITPNLDLNKFQIPIFPNCLEKFPNQVRFVYISGPIRVPNLIKVFPKFM